MLSQNRDWSVAILVLEQVILCNIVNVVKGSILIQNHVFLNPIKHFCCVLQASWGPFKMISTPSKSTSRSSCAALKHNPGSAGTEWPTHSGTDVNAQISVCLACLQASRPILCEITLKHTAVQINQCEKCHKLQ